MNTPTETAAALMALLPEHKCSLTITHNQHRDYYESAEEYCTRENGGTWKNEEARQRAIATDEVWEMQWYPETPNGCHILCAPTLAELLAWARQEVHV